MIKEDWQKLYDNLDKVYTDFLLAYPNYDGGSNKKIRAEGQRKVESAIRLAKRYILNNTEAYNLLTGGEGNNSYGRAITFDEFEQPRYFRNDMGDYLEKIKEKIKSVE